MFRFNSAPQPLHAVTVRRGAEAVAEWRATHPDEALDLTDADLRGAILAGVDLRGANLKRADLTGANLAGAKLHHACLHDADLTDAQLATCEGLLAGQLAGADLSGASLPPTIAVDRLEEAARCGDMADYARTIFMWMIGGCAFVWLMLISTTQLQLLTNDGTVRLPVFDVEAPSEVFFLLGPFLLIGVYYYLHVYLQRIWDTLARLPAVYPDGEPLDRKTHGWMVLGLVRWQRKRMTGAPPMFFAQTLLSVLLTWSLAPVTVYAVWHRCAVRHQWNQSMMQVVACATIAYVAIGSLAAARAAFCPQWQWVRWLGQVGVSLGVLFGLHTVMQQTFDGRSELSWFNAMVDHYHPTDRTPKWGRDKRGLQNRYLALTPFYTGFAGERDPPYTMDVKQKLEGLGLSWREAYAEFGGPLLTNAHLQGVLIKHSDLSSADLSGSACQRAKLLSVDLTQASLHGARFDHAILNDVVLLGVGAQQASFSDATAFGFVALGADFTGGAFERFAATGTPADLRGAKLDGARMNDAVLPAARLQGASLVGARLENAVLVHADLSHANLSEADLRGADLRGANLHGADLTGAVLQDAKVGELTWSYGQNKVSLTTVLDDADLRGAHGDIPALVALAMYNEGTRWDARQDSLPMVAAGPDAAYWDGQQAPLPSLMQESAYPDTGFEAFALPAN